MLFRSDDSIREVITRRGAFLRRPTIRSATGCGYNVTNTYAAFFSPDDAPRIFFIQAEKRWRFCSRRTTASLVTQLNWITRRGPENGLWPCQELLLRRKASNVPSVGGTSRIMSSRLFPERSSRRRPPVDSHPAFI